MAWMALVTTISFAQKDWAQFGRYEEQNTKIDFSAEAVFMGNSITDNWYKFDTDFFTKNDFIGRGISGQTTAEMLVRFRRDVIDLRPKVVVILAGINDIAQNNGIIKLENVMGNIASMCELSKIHNIKVVLCSVLPCNHFSWKPEMKPAEDVRLLNGMIKNYASQHNITYVDYYTPLVNKEGGLSKELSDDGCHPKFNCYTTMEVIVVKGINTALKSNKKHYISTPKG